MMTMMESFSYIPGTEIPANFFSIYDRDELADVEMAFASMRYLQGDPGGDLDKDHLKAIHRHLFGDVYPWAGSYRTIRRQREGEQFVSPEIIDSELDSVFSRLQNQHYLTQTPVEDLPTKVAEYYTAFLKVFPFPDGNGRAIRMFLEILTKDLNFKLNWKMTNQAEWNLACEVACAGEISQLAGIFDRVMEMQQELQQDISNRQKRVLEKHGIERFHQLIESGEHVLALRGNRFKHYDIPDRKESPRTSETEPINDDGPKL